jgi:hypothetical protein
MQPKFVFICAAGHSGSTLLDLLLGSHPRGLSVGEITQLPKNIALDSLCSCGTHLSQCEFWRHLITDFGNSIGINLWKDPYQLNLGFIKAGREIDSEHQTRYRMMMRKLSYGAEYARLRWRVPLPNFLHQSIQQGSDNKCNLFRFILKQTGQQFIVDSSKHYLEALSLYKAAANETRIISLQRDGRAVFNSGIRRGIHPKLAINSWARHAIRSKRVFEKHVPETALLTVCYEALARRPEFELRRIAEFLEIDFSQEMLDFGRPGSHIVNGNRMRFSQNSDIKLDERWREELSAPMLRFFERRAGKLNQQLGYSN